MVILKFFINRLKVKLQSIVIVCFIKKKNHLAVQVLYLMRQN